MKLQALSVALLVSTGLSACTTVDLSQVAVQSEPVEQIQAKQNVVQRAAMALTSKFRNNGWCSGGPQEKTQTATSVLLNGMDDQTGNSSKKYTLVKSEQLASDLAVANQHVVQTTKAAEVYLSMSGDSSLDDELSLLETALLSAREAETRFKKAIDMDSDAMSRQNYETLQSSVNELKAVTDLYGDRIRSNIATKVVASRS